MQIGMTSKVSINELVALAKAAAAEAADYQERFAAEDLEARKIVDIMERFLRVKGRVVYGGAAINAHLSPEHKFYDPSLYLPDYDFMTPDPLQDCADLIVAFQDEGFEDVEAKFGIHEGTYKIFVNYRSAADITFMPPTIYDRVVADADMIEGIRYASVNFLRMNIYLELSRPAGMVSRWEKVYERLLLLNEEHPPTAGRCTKEPLAALATETAVKKTDVVLHQKIVNVGISNNAIFLSGISQLVDVEPATTGVVLLLSDKVSELTQALKRAGLKPTPHDAMGELLPARTEFHTTKKQLVAVVFEAVACHNYINTSDGLRLGSLDLLIQMYYAMYFADLQGYVPVRLLCIIQELIELEVEGRRTAVANGKKPEEVFPMDCIGHQPTMPELKKAHRERVAEKREELTKVLRLQNSPRFSATRKRRRSAKTE
jgi:hypothetical protein